jgi:secondary thiamine-phosphate synthase enzyme
VNTLSIRTSRRKELVSITAQVSALVRAEGWNSGALLLFCPHTTAALTVNESADPDVAADMCRFMGKLVPVLPDFRHAEGNSDAHIQSSLFGPSLMLIVEDGSLCLGTWQGVYFCEWDGPRARNIWAQFLPGA